MSHRGHPSRPMIPSWFILRSQFRQSCFERRDPSREMATTTCKGDIEINRPVLEKADWARVKLTVVLSAS